MAELYLNRVSADELLSNNKIYMVYKTECIGPTLSPGSKMITHEVMNDPKPRGTKIKGRTITIIGIKGHPDMWLVFDEPNEYPHPEQNDLCRTYYYQDKLHAMTTYNKLIKAYKKSRKYHYEKAYEFRGSNTNG